MSRMKFVRSRGNTNETTKQTMTADQIIGNIIDSNNAFIPIAVGPHGEIGSLFRRFLTGRRALPLPNFSEDRPNAKRAADTAISTKTPYDILGKANKIWRNSNGDRPFGGTYLSSTPQIWADQHLGLAIQSNLATHIKKSLTKMKYNQSNNSPPSNATCEQRNDEEDIGWSCFDGPLDNNVDLMDDLFGMRGDDVLDISGEVPVCSNITQDNLASTGGD